MSNIPRPISIRPVLNGYVAQVGCQEVAFTSMIDLINNLTDYLDDPKGVEKYWLSTARHKPNIAEVESRNQAIPVPQGTSTAPDFFQQGSDCGQRAGNL